MDEPIRMAGGSLGLAPADIRQGLMNGSLRGQIVRERLPQMGLPAVSLDDAVWMANGAYEPKVAFGF